MNRYQHRLTPKAGEFGLGMAPTNNNNNNKISSNSEQEKSLQHQVRLRRPQKERKPDQPLPCICNRDKQVVLCQSCGSYFEGRVKKECAQHPKAIFLLDVSCCPKCRAGLEALKEFPNIVQQQQQRPRQRLNSVKKRKCDTPENSEMEMGDTE